MEAAVYRYHYGRTTAPIYSTSDGYVCATSNGKSPPKYNDLLWVKAEGLTAEFLNKNGKTVWITREK